MQIQCLYQSIFTYVLAENASLCTALMCADVTSAALWSLLASWMTMVPDSSPARFRLNIYNEIMRFVAKVIVKLLFKKKKKKIRQEIMYWLSQKYIALHRISKSTFMVTRFDRTLWIFCTNPDLAICIEISQLYSMQAHNSTIAMTRQFSKLCTICCCNHFFYSKKSHMI